ncbi:MAG: FtsX-like permease family protein [Proteobacteria bacterium]|nr:FtsX-like permease family protein [Pseudomonadota bacterium]MBU1687988.1 FtsX-like permease family protein [Pseudomonadota bacterium]
MKLYNISFNNLRRRQGKMVFLVMGLFIGIATIVTLLSITDSMSRDIEDRLDQFGANIVMVPKSDNLSLSYGGISVGGVSYESTDFDEASIQKIFEIENSKNLGAVVPKILGSAEVSGRKVLLMGTVFEDELNLKTWWQYEGQLPMAGEIMVGSAAAATLELSLNQEVPIGSQTFKVGAVLHPTGGPEDNIIVGNLAEMQQVLGKVGRISMVEISAFCRGCPISDMVLQIAAQFPEGKVTALKQAVMSKMQSIEMFKSFSYGIAVLVVFIGSLLVFVTMMGSVNERTREIGIFRAIGFRRGHVMQIILLEAMVVGLVGGLLGYLGGNGAAWAVMPLVLKDGAFAGINTTLGVVSILLAVTLSLLASLYPALKASRLDPSEALRAL